MREIRNIYISYSTVILNMLNLVIASFFKGMNQVSYIIKVTQLCHLG